MIYWYACAECKERCALTVPTHVCLHCGSRDVVLYDIDDA